ncbi:protein LNK1-like isoform X2 [Iris pallida]|uniref:Protein LNK1-like isoform X2 n=1 Tax=Iris pallida TaxID=29817 RepID=A0AAX6DS76_IRIPA|nr:protein LNK1-like isoform X2 [Iris pallida]
MKTLDLVHTSKKNDFSGCGTSNVMEGQPSSQEKGIKRSADKMFLVTDMTAPQMYTSKQFSQQKHFIDSTPSSFMQNIDLHGQMVYGLPTHQLPITQATSCTEFEDDTMPCSSLNDLDHLVNCQTQERRPNQFYRPQTTRQEENLGKEHQRQQSSIKMTVEHSHQQSAFRNKTSAWVKQLETRGGIEQEDIGLELSPVETNSKVAHKSSCMTSVVSDDISFKATSFLQLQDVMHQLDVRTKQCIRDSLYRLARSAHHRHSFSNTNSLIEPNIDLLGIQNTVATKSADPVDAETNTNPIDRYIAHLLFHKPSEPAARSIDDATSLGSHVIDFQHSNLP